MSTEGTSLTFRENAVRAIFAHYEAPEHIAMGIRVLLREQPGTQIPG